MILGWIEVGTIGDRLKSPPKDGFEEQFIRLQEYTKSEFSQAHIGLDTMFKQMRY